MVKKIIFISIIAVGIFLRLYQLNSLPAGLFLDEINVAVDAKALAQNGVDQYGRPFPFYFEDATDFKLPVYIYLTAFFFKLLGPQIITVTLTATIAGILSIFLIGYLSKLLFPQQKMLPYFSMATLALSPLAIHFSRIGDQPIVALCFLIIYLIALVKVLLNVRPNLWFIIGSIAIFLADWTYPAPKVIIPIFTICILVSSFIFSSKKIKKDQIGQACCFLIVVFITFIPSLKFPFPDQRQLALTSVDLSHPSWHSILNKMYSTIVSFIRLWNFEFLFDKGDLFAYRHGTKENGIFLLIFSLPYIAGLLWCIKNFGSKNFGLIFLFLLTLIAGLPSSLSSDVPYATRVVSMLIPYTLIIALGINQLFLIVNKRNSFMRMVIFSIVGSLLLFQIGSYSYIYFVDFRETSAPEFSKPPVELAQFIKEFQKTNPKSDIYFLNVQSCRSWGNDALNLWYFADLPNNKMIQWNNKYRLVRYTNYGTSPFESYDRVKIPQATIDTIHLYPGYGLDAKVPVRSLIIECGIHIKDVDLQRSKILKIIYLYDDVKRDPYYVITQKI